MQITSLNDFSSNSLLSAFFTSNLEDDDGNENKDKTRKDKNDSLTISLQLNAALLLPQSRSTQNGSIGQ